MSERDPQLDLQDLIEACREMYDGREDAGLNTGAHFLTWPEFLRIELWNAGYRKQARSSSSTEKES